MMMVISLRRYYILGTLIPSTYFYQYITLLRSSFMDPDIIKLSNFAAYIGLISLAITMVLQAFPTQFP